VLLDSSRIPGLIVDVLAVRGDVLEKNPQQVRALVRGWFRALAYRRREPTSALARMSMRQQMTPQALARSMEGLRFVGVADNRRLLAGATPALRARADDLAKLMHRRALLPGLPALGHLCDARGLPR